jgi:hypothetical protein
MALVDPKNPNRPLSLSDVRAMIARGEADVDAGLVYDLDAERRAGARSKPSAA